MTDGAPSPITEEQLALLTTLSPFVIAGVLEAKIAERLRATTDMALEAVRADPEVELLDEVRDADLREFGVYFLEVLAAARDGAQAATDTLGIAPDAR